MKIAIIAGAFFPYLGGVQVENRWKKQQFNL